MSVLSPGAVARLRSFIARGFTATAAVNRRVVAEGPGGTTTTTLAVVTGLSAVPCSFAPAAAPDETVAADAVQAVARYVVKLPAGTAVAASHVIVITHAEPGMPSPLTLEVVGAYYKSGEIVRWVLCELAGGA